MRIFAVVALVLSGALEIPLAATADSAGVPAGVKIPVELTQQITSLTTHVGETFTFKTTKAETLGALHVPAGTPGHGRVAVVTVAHDKVHGSLALQADSLDLADGGTVWVNVDAARPIRAHLSDKHTRWRIVPLPIGILPISSTSRSGNMVLESGTPFTVITIVPRQSPAPLLTAPPTPTPAPSLAPSSVPSPVPSSGPSPVPSSVASPGATRSP